MKKRAGAKKANIYVNYMLFSLGGRVLTAGAGGPLTGRNLMCTQNERVAKFSKL